MFEAFSILYEQPSNDFRITFDRMTVPKAVQQVISGMDSCEKIRWVFIEKHDFLMRNVIKLRVYLL